MTPACRFVSLPLDAITPEQQAQLRALLADERVRRRALHDVVRRALTMVVRWIEKSESE